MQRFTLKLMTFCFGLLVTAGLMIAIVETDFLLDEFPLSMLLPYAVLALTVWPLARHTHQFSLPAALRRFGFILWLLSILSILALAWVRPPPPALLVFGVLYGAVFVLFILMALRYYSQRDESQRHAA